MTDRCPGCQRTPSSICSSPSCLTRRLVSRGTRATWRPTGTVEGDVTVQGRFNHETFSLSQGGPANGSDPTQGVTDPAVKDTNVVFRPTSQFHVGLWFNRPQDAANAGCPGNVTPFNGEQHAGTQILSTRNFPADHGPLEAIG